MIENVNGVTHITGSAPVSQGAARVSEDFKLALSDALNKVNDQQIQAEQLNAQLAAGEVDNLHQVTVAAEKASLSLQLALQVRNKVVEAYTEVMRMQI